MENQQEKSQEDMVKEAVEEAKKAAAEKTQEEDMNSTTKLSTPKFVLPKRCTVLKMGQRLRDQQTNDWPNMRPTP